MYQPTSACQTNCSLTGGQTPSVSSSAKSQDDEAILLDASALIALLNGESGAERVERVLARAAITSVNLAEVVSKLIERGIPPADVRAMLEEFDLIVVAIGATEAFAAGALRATTKSFGLSLGDRICLAVAQLHSGRIRVLTTDTVWTKIALGDTVTIEVIR
jgi:PIN domain nuclease of toxin-antitoxin system